MRARKHASQERVQRPDGRRGEFARYQRVAPPYDLLDLPFEYGRYRALRRRMFEGLSGSYCQKLVTVVSGGAFG